MSTFDNAVEATRLLALADEVPMHNDGTAPEAAILHSEALVRATLALVEQQRLANLIAAASTYGITDRVVDLGFTTADALVAHIREGLGL